ncbi:DNAJ1 [Symbiodinium natans]|uniref:DNAJ1 protein n=1 Tax=Symbiodinium natans TaxID=878477 RepID=A0A812M7Z2_9DINO|nr:DNAJ1 [Symbiodinium natans]
MALVVGCRLLPSPSHGGPGYLWADGLAPRTASAPRQRQRQEEALAGCSLIAVLVSSRRQPQRPRRSTQVRATERGEEDPWVVLGISKAASATEVRRAFRARVRGSHPDMGGDPERFLSLNRAYDRAMAHLEGREPPAEPVVAEAPPEVKAPSEPTKKSATTLEDFRSWRRQQQPRRDVRRRLENQQRRAKRGIARRRRSEELAAQKFQQNIQRVASEAQTPEERALWEREVRGPNQMEIETLWPEFEAGRLKAQRRRDAEQRWHQRRSRSWNR